ncbi:MAG TPA: cupin domain-containing protein [Burkholderiales bacterium]|nr:cupin domain-containing protein [Burkholderiales bacterium]
MLPSRLEAVRQYRSVVVVVLTSVAFSSALAQDKPRPRVTENPVSIAPGELNWRPCGKPSPDGCEIALTRTEVKDHVEYFFRAPASTRWPKHWHTNASFLIGVHGSLTINLETGEQHMLLPGGYMYIPGGMIHWAACGEQEPCTVFEYMYNFRDSFRLQE